MLPSEHWNQDVLPECVDYQSNHNYLEDLVHKPHSENQTTITTLKPNHPTYILMCLLACGMVSSVSFSMYSRAACVQSVK